MDFIIVAVGVALVFVWPIWFLTTMSTMKNTLRGIHAELVRQGEQLRVGALEQEFEPSGDDEADRPEYWCPNCRDYFDVSPGRASVCPKCKKVGHSAEG